MQPIPRDQLVALRDYQQCEIRGSDPYAERSSRGNYSGEQPGEGRHPLQVGVAVVGLVLEERDPRGSPELNGVVQLQARVRKVSALFRTYGLPCPGR
jgi:hypothetical protein